MFILYDLQKFYWNLSSFINLSVFSELLSEAFVFSNYVSFPQPIKMIHGKNEWMGTFNLCET